jgi:tRNA-binding EMAP/Myf-like protein
MGIILADDNDHYKSLFKMLIDALEYRQILSGVTHMKWQDRRLLDLFGIDHPIVQAPMAGVTSPQMAIAASEAGGLGSIAAAMLSPGGTRPELQMV